jgi:hypothetical protein
MTVAIPSCHHWITPLFSADTSRRDEVDIFEKIMPDFGI